MVFQLIRGKIRDMNKPLILGSMILILLVSCSRSADRETPVPDATILPSPTLDPTESAGERYPSSGVIYQWGTDAEASSEFANPEWAAVQAAGAPDAPGCGDYQYAWASAASDSLATLDVIYRTQVYPLEIIIIESFNPDQVTKVEIFDPETGGYYTVLQKNPIRIDRNCPYQLIVPVEGIGFKTNQVRITVDQSQLGLGWNEIDAVQLIGSIQEP
jgi:hypothetical protein